MEKLVLARLEALVIEKHEAARRIKDLENELLLAKSAMDLMKSSFEDQISNLRGDLREAGNHIKRMKFDGTRKFIAEKPTHMPIIMGEPALVRTFKEPTPMPAIPRDKWNEIIKMIVHDTSVPESERHWMRQVQRFRHSVGSTAPGVKEVAALIRNARREFGMSDLGPSISDNRTAIILPASLNNNGSDPIKLEPIKPNKIIEVGGTKVYNNQPRFGTPCFVER